VSFLYYVTFSLFSQPNKLLQQVFSPRTGTPYGVQFPLSILSTKILVRRNSKRTTVTFFIQRTLFCFHVIWTNPSIDYSLNVSLGVLIIWVSRHCLRLQLVEVVNFNISTLVWMMNVSCHLWFLVEKLL